jgi:hypothetical protein
MIQGTRPLTLANSLNDSPAGLAAWLVDKYQRWSDCGDDIETCFSKDELLTNVTIYWATQTAGSSRLCAALASISPRPTRAIPRMASRRDPHRSARGPLTTPKPK